MLSHVTRHATRDRSSGRKVRPHVHQDGGSAARVTQGVRYDFAVLNGKPRLHDARPPNWPSKGLEDRNDDLLRDGEFVVIVAAAEAISNLINDLPHRGGHGAKRPGEYPTYPNDGRRPRDV